MANSTEWGSDQPTTSIDSQYYASIHSYMIVIPWLVAGNAGLWVQAFKNFKWAHYVHMACMSLITIITLMNGFMAILIFGIPNSFTTLHTGMGITVILSFTIQSIGGFITLLAQKGSNIHPKLVQISNYIHVILGKVLYVLMLVPILVPTRYSKPYFFVSTLCICITSYLLFILYKIFRRRIQSMTYQKQMDLIAIQKITELQKYNGQFFFFADKIYKLDNLLTNHPGGYELIKLIRNRDVDKFLYGSQPLQSLNKMITYHHTYNSIQLAGPPIAKWVSSIPYRNMQQVNSVKIIALDNPCKNPQLFLIYVQSRVYSDSFYFTRYNNLSQLGKSFTITLDGHITRLYTQVNFLRYQNLITFQKILGRQFQIFKNKQGRNQNQSSIYQFPANQSTILNSCIPLLIKRYDKGKFTNKFLSCPPENEQILLSKPRGRGLKLNQINDGQIIIFAGGTGINPFCDMIDLLYKEMLIQNHDSFSQQIGKIDPLATQGLLMKRFKFTLFLSVQNYDQLHDITIFQINQLARNELMTAYLRISDRKQIKLKNLTRPEVQKVEDTNDSQINKINQVDRIEKNKIFFKQNSYIQQIDPKLRFNEFIFEISKRKSSIAQIYICGPHSMAYSLYKELVQCNFGENQYTFL